MGILLSGSLQVFATSGIAVSMRADSTTLYPGINKPFCCTESPTFGKLHVYRIQNDQVISDKVLDTTANFCTRWATLNISGTKCAYFSETIGPNGGGGFMAASSYIVVINTDGSNRRILLDLKDVSGDAQGYMDWPVGDWIYFNIGGNNTAGSSQIWRVNEKTLVKEKVVTLPYSAWVWSLSAHADKMTVRKGDSSRCSNEILRFAFPSEATTACSNQSLAYSQGCTNAISPSGNYIFWTVDAGHSSYQFGNYASSTGASLVLAKNYNDWAVNCNAIKMTCDDGNVYTVGDGCEENRWSANSDKWVSFRIGWQQGGRWDDRCGSNQVLVNWKDKKTIMVSFNPRACTENWAAFCPAASFTGKYIRKQEAGDFVVTAPDSEINADLRQYVSINRGLYNENGTKLIKPGVANFEGGSIALRFDTEGTHQITIVDAKGVVRGNFASTGSSMRISTRNFRSGVYVAKIRLDGQKSYKAQTFTVD